MGFLQILVRAAVTKHKFRATIVVLYLLANYYFHLSLATIRNQYILQLAFGCTALGHLLESSLRLLVMIPLRNTAIKLARLQYLEQVLSDQMPYYNDSDYGILYSRVKRIEIIYSGIERDLLGLVIYLPLTCLYTYRAVVKSETWLTVLFIPINLMALLIVRGWVQMRQKAFAADEKLGQETLKLFHNVGRTDSVTITDINQALDAEMDSYSRAMLYKQYYKLALIIPNMILIGIISRLVALDSKQMLNLIFFALNWTHFSMSFISLIGIVSGLYTPKIGQKRTPSKISGIQIKDLNVTNIFNNVSLLLKSGTKASLTGPNGSGKTLLLRIISGCVPEFSESVYAPSDAKKCMVITDSNSPFKVEKLRLSQNQRWQSRFGEKYGGLLTRDLLSRGESNFLTVSSILMYNPAIVLIDEALDSMTGSLLDDIISFLMEEKTTLLVVSHREEILIRFPVQLYIDEQKVKQ